MVDSSRFSSLPEEGEIQILSSEKLEDVIQEITGLRGSDDGDFDSSSIDNAVRLCEKMDICFENLENEQKLIILQNYEFFSSSYQFTLFLKLMFHGGLSAKEITFRALARKLRATQDVIRSVLSTKILFETQELEEEVQHELKTFMDSLVHHFVQLIPPNIRKNAPKPLSVDWLLMVLNQHEPIFDLEEMTYNEVTRLFTDLLYTIFSHEQLPIYFHWKDEFLRHWLIDTLREEDRFDSAPTPVLSAAKAELYVEYINWTKIAKRLNANLRHRQTFDTDTTIRAEKVLLDRMPSNVLLELVLKLRLQMKKVDEVPEVDLGIDDESIDEMAMYNEMIEDILDSEDVEGNDTWLGKIASKIKEFFVPKEEEPEETVEQMERTFTDGLVEAVVIDFCFFGKSFPKDYSSDIPKQFSLFFTKHRTNFYSAFEEMVQEVLMVYEDHDMSLVTYTERQMPFSDAKQNIDYEERCVALPIDGNFLLLLGNAHFQKTFMEHNKHPAPQAYFNWFEKTEKLERGVGRRHIEDQAYQEIQLNQIGGNADFAEGWIRVLDGLPDESFEKAHVQQCLNFFHQMMTA